MWFVFRLIPVALAGLGSAARADITAHYVSVDPGFGLSEELEIASNGDIRMSASAKGFPAKPNQYVLRHNGHGYRIWPGPKGPVVIRVEDVAIVKEEIVAKVLKENQLPKSLTGLNAEAPVTEWQKGEAMIVRGRLGTSYRLFIKFEDRPIEIPRDLFVISNDPSLKPLSDANIFLYDNISILPRSMSDKSGIATDDILKTGAPLIFQQMELDAVNFDSIPAARFSLPAEPLSLEEARKFMTPSDQ